MYPHYVAKAEVDAIVEWLTGYGPEALKAELKVIAAGMKELRMAKADRDIEKD